MLHIDDFPESGQAVPAPTGEVAHVSQVAAQSGCGPAGCQESSGDGGGAPLAAVVVLGGDGDDDGGDNTHQRILYSAPV